ncbi:probable G-protein coupled receptor No18 [Paramacrobiotus metropolitanus]|uniref:probable G-protein coupled receptor No18 n=1 Tax=Paramacrobiotus metropolitanus TaxID=2943436 RepID=UPI002446221E|nr:probable G-protein coupled receptor No18 [Paramacrobiotus metropolitanus]
MVTNIIGAVNIADHDKLLFDGNFSNNGTEKVNPEYKLGTLGATFLLIFLGLMTIVGVVGNVLVILSVALNRKLRTVTNCFIVSLAVADLLVANFVMPISAVMEVTGGEWYFGTLVCWIFISADVFLCTASIWNLLIISWERFMAISWPLWYGARRTKKVAIYLIALAWTVSVVICMPPLFLQGIFEDATAGGGCNYVTNEIYRVYSACGSFWIPLAIILFCYARIFSVAGRKNQILDRHKSCSYSSIKHNPVRPVLNGPNNVAPSYPSTSSNELHDVGGLLQQLPATARQMVLRGASITETHLSSSTALIEIKFDDVSPIANFPMASATAPPIIGNGLDRTRSLRLDELPRGRGLRRRVTVNGQAALSRLSSFKDRERKVFKVLLIILCSFVACWFGFFLIYTLQPFCEGCRQLDHRIYAFFVWLGYFNSALNPLIYAGFSKEFRTAFLNILCCKCLLKRRRKGSACTGKV